MSFLDSFEPMTSAESATYVRAQTQRKRKSNDPGKRSAKRTAIVLQKDGYKFVQYDETPQNKDIVKNCKRSVGANRIQIYLNLYNQKY